MKSWCIPAASAKFVAKMEDVLDVYQRPYDPKRPVVCVDEMTKELTSTPYGTLPISLDQNEGLAVLRALGVHGTILVQSDGSSDFTSEAFQ